MSDNLGAQKLRALGLSQGKIAERVGTKPSVVSRWVRGDRKPGLALRVEIARVWPAIKILDFDEPARPEVSA
jgi:transcriptional regulator with XRE-family HTH domain